MPDYRRSKYIKTDRNSAPKKKKQGLFDLPDGSKKDVFKQPKKQPNTPHSKKSGAFDLPSGYGKKQAIERQQAAAKKRELERQGIDNRNKPKGQNPMVFGSGSGSTSQSNYIKFDPKAEQPKSQNLEKNFSKSSPAAYYMKEIGYYLRPIFYYLLASVVFILLGALGRFNGVDLRLACLTIFPAFLFVGGIFVNRHMSVPGFIILIVVNTAGAIIGQTGLIEKLPNAAARLVKVFNLIYYSYDTESVRLNTIVVLLSVIAPAIIVYLGSRLHKLLYPIRAKLKKQNVKQEQEDMKQLQEDLIQNEIDADNTK